VNTSRLRNFSATLVTLSGLSHLAELWLRDLNVAAIINALLGATYLFIGIGLYGRSRFALFLTAIVPVIVAALAINGYPIDGSPMLVFDSLARAQISAEIIAAIFCALILFTVRNDPSI
jgi:hypothetical protein